MTGRMMRRFGTAISLLLVLLLIGFSDAAKDKEATQSTESTVEESTKTSSKSKTILFFGDSLTAGYGL